MKTPEEIAVEYAHKVYRPEPLNLGDIGEVIRQAIEADRAQREERTGAVKPPTVGPKGGAGDSGAIRGRLKLGPFGMYLD